MQHIYDLFEFNAIFLDIQIKKYDMLTRIGVGPDAGMNAYLVKNQVDELFRYQEQLLYLIKNDEEDDEIFNNVYSQIKFYLDQEYLRGYAGWLIDENNIHTPEYNRLLEQQDRINKIATTANISTNNKYKPVNDTQKQCQHNSHEIAYLILDVAVQLKNNPDLNFNGNIPAHAMRIMKAHVSKPDSRYNNDKIWREISRLHQECLSFLTLSPLDKSTQRLERKEAAIFYQKDADKLKTILVDYQRTNPEASLFENDGRWYNISLRPAAAAPPLIARQSFFHKPTLLLAASATVAICSFILLVSSGYQAFENNNSAALGL